MPPAEPLDQVFGIFGEPVPLLVDAPVLGHLLFHLVEGLQLLGVTPSTSYQTRPSSLASIGSFSTPTSVAKAAFSSSVFCGNVRRGAVGRLALAVDLIEHLIGELELVGDLRELGAGGALVLDAIVEVEDRALRHGP